MDTFLNGSKSIICFNYSKFENNLFCFKSDIIVEWLFYTTCNNYNAVGGPGDCKMILKSNDTLEFLCIHV